jgi:hypothetical protein
MESLNGIFFDSEAVTERVLQNGDILRIGDNVSITYSVPAEEPVAVPVESAGQPIEPVPEPVEPSAPEEEPVAIPVEPEPAPVEPSSPVKEHEPLPVTPPPPVKIKPAAAQSKPAISWRLAVLLIVLFIIATGAGLLLRAYVLSP